MEEGDKVRCMRGNIDRDQHAGEVGVISGFARFSQYHAREVSVRTEGGAWLGWFWMCDVQKVETAS